MSEWKSNPRALAASSYRRWQPPSWDAVGSDADSLQTGVSGASSPIAAAALEQLQQDAYAEAHALGLEEGRAAGRQESAAQVARWSALIDVLTQPWKMVDRRVETELIKLVQVYTIARTTAESWVSMIERTALEPIAAMVRERTGLRVEVYGG